MLRTIGRKLLWAYALLMLIAAIGYARYDFYLMDGDGTAFMDIAQYLRSGHANLAINGYWNPGYPAILSAAEALTHPSLWRELVIVRYTNVLIFAFAMATCVFFTTGLTRARALDANPDTWAAVPDGALHLLGLALLVLSFSRELPIAAPRADTLLLAFLLLAMGLVLRLRTGSGLWTYAALGLTLGCAYLTKSFAFLPSSALLFALLVYGALHKAAARKRILLGFLLASAAFALTAGPYLVAISRQLGHPTTGDSARLNYAFFIDGTERWHEWYHHTLGQASGTFLHAEQPLAANPPVFSYAAHPFGTFPLWFDPAWWTAGLKPHIYLPGQVDRVLRNAVVFWRYLLGRPEPFVLLALVLAFGATWPPLRSRAALRNLLWALVPLGWGLLMLGIYFPVDLQDRYLTGPFLLVLLPFFALLRLRPQRGNGDTPSFAPTPLIATALVLLFAGIGIVQSATFIAERRRERPAVELSHPGYNGAFFAPAAALDELGLRRGDSVACMGGRACDTDHYWARLAGAQILGEVETPNGADPLAVWNSIPDKRTVTAPLQAMGLRYIVTIFSNAGDKPDGWVQLGHTDFFAYPLQQPVSPQRAAAIAAYEPTP